MIEAFYDREQQPISMSRWTELMDTYDHETRVPYRQVASDIIGGEYLVSTVWLGLDHSWWDGPPLIFETMVFVHNEDLPTHLEPWDMDGISQVRYSTEEEALAGHAEKLEMVRSAVVG